MAKKTQSDNECNPQEIDGLWENLFGKKSAGKKVKPNKKAGNSDPDNNPDNYRIEKGDCFYHKESRKLYQVTDFERGVYKNSGKPCIIVVYIGADLSVRKQSYQLFLQNFEKTAKPFYSKSQMKKQQDKLSFALKQGKTLQPNEKSENDLASESDTSEDGESVPLGTLYEPSERHNLDNMILWPDTLESINVGIESISKRDEIKKVWGLEKITDNVNQNILNFFGVSGTGKTMAAQCIARKLGRKLYQVDYSQIVDKYVGETGKHIALAFATAKEKNAILFMDEADGLLSKRVDMTVNSDYANSVNQNRNVLMQELDKFDDIVIMSTNFFCNYDEAMLRRINRHIEFKLPNREMRKKLFAMHIPNPDRTKDVDFDSLAGDNKGMSGGDIKSACFNSIEIASMDKDNNKWILTQDIMRKECQKILDSKESHKKGTQKSKTAIGFNSKIIEDVD